VKMFDADESRMIGLPHGEKNYDDMLSRFRLIPERYGQTNRFAISLSISRVSILRRDKNWRDDRYGPPYDGEIFFEDIYSF